MTETTYEQALDHLRRIVQQLESGQQGLEQSLQLFEEGINLTRFCDDKLKSVEDRVKILLSRNQSQDLSA